MNSSGGLGMPDGNPVEEPTQAATQIVKETSGEGNQMATQVRTIPRENGSLGGIFTGQSWTVKRSRENGSLIRRLNGKTGVWR